MNFSKRHEILLSTYYLKRSIPSICLLLNPCPPFVLHSPPTPPTPTTKKEKKQKSRIHTFFKPKSEVSLRTFGQSWFSSSTIFYLPLFLCYIKMNRILVDLFLGKVRTMMKMLPCPCHLALCRTSHTKEKPRRKCELGTENPLALKLFWSTDALILVAILSLFCWKFPKWPIESSDILDFTA